MSSPTFDPAFELVCRQGLTYLQSPLFAQFGLIRHAFMTKKLTGGETALEELDLSSRHDAEPAAQNAGWQRLAACFSLKPSDFVTLRQVHQDRVLILDPDLDETHRGRDGRPAFYGSAEGGGFDAVITSRPGLALAIRTADCVPLLIADPRRKVVAAVHAGWRGAALGIAAKTVETFQARYGSDVADLFALSGPSIGPCCYQVDRPVFDSLGGGGPCGPFFQPRGDEHWQFNLSGLIAAQLKSCGLKAEKIHRSTLCTSCRPDLFFSHRRSRGEGGRQLSFIGLLT